MATPFQIRHATHALRRGGIVAYPTESVFGLGCNPLNGAAVLRLLALKQRPIDKGLILIASELVQLEPFLQPLAKPMLRRISQRWPGPTTWLLPARSEVPQWLCGHHNTLAVRVTAHPLAAALCDSFGGALVSTSANRSNQPPARSALRVEQYFDNRLDYTLHGELGGNAQPTEIRDAANGRLIRAG